MFVYYYNNLYFSSFAYTQLKIFAKLGRGVVREETHIAPLLRLCIYIAGASLRVADILILYILVLLSRRRAPALLYSVSGQRGGQDDDMCVG